MSDLEKATKEALRRVNSARSNLLIERGNLAKVAKLLAKAHETDNWKQIAKLEPKIASIKAQIEMSKQSLSTAELEYARLRVQQIEQDLHTTLEDIELFRKELGESDSD